MWRMRWRFGFGVRRLYLFFALDVYLLRLAPWPFIILPVPHVRQHRSFSLLFTSNCSHHLNHTYSSPTQTCHITQFRVYRTQSFPPLHAPGYKSANKPQNSSAAAKINPRPIPQIPTPIPISQLKLIIFVIGDKAAHVLVNQWRDDQYERGIGIVKKRKMIHVE